MKKQRLRSEGSLTLDATVTAKIARAVAFLGWPVAEGMEGEAKNA